MRTTLSLVIASVHGSDDRLRAAHHLMTKLKSCVAQPQGEDLLLVTLDVPSANTRAEAENAAEALIGEALRELDLHKWERRR